MITVVRDDRALVPPGGTFTNTATVSAATSDPVPANNSASQTTTISVSADLAVTKTDGVASVVAGTSTDYTITLTNNGPSAVAAGVIVSDLIPAGTVGSETEPNCAIAASTFTCTTTAVVASGASVVYHLILAVPANYAPATVVNTATITSAPASDPTPANNAATDTDTVTRSADLSIVKIDSADPVVPGQSFTYTLTATNDGPSNASTLQVSTRARAVHRDERDLAGRHMWPRRQRRHVHPAGAGRRGIVGRHGLGDGEPRGAGGHLYEHRDRERCHSGSGARQ